MLPVNAAAEDVQQIALRVDVPQWHPVVYDVAEVKDIEVKQAKVEVVLFLEIH